MDQPQAPKLEDVFLFIRIILPDVLRAYPEISCAGRAADFSPDKAILRRRADARQGKSAQYGGKYAVRAVCG